MERKKPPKIFFGWWTVIAASLLSSWSLGFYTYGISVLFLPIASELNINRAATSVASSLGRLEGGIEAPLAGWFTDRFGPKWIVIFGVFLFGLGLVLMNSAVNSVWTYYLIWGFMIATGNNIGMGLPLDKAITSWFVRKRGLATAIRWVIAVAAPGLVLPLVAWLVSTQGWRTTCLIGGLVMWFVGLPLAFFSVKQHRPEYYGLLPDGASTKGELADTSQMIDKGAKYAAEVQETEFTLRQAIRTPAFWLLIAVNAAWGLVIPAILTHFIPFLTDMGIDPVKAAIMMGTAAFISLIPRLIAGLAADRVKTNYLRFLAMAIYILQAVGITAFLLKQTTTMAYVFLIPLQIAFGVTPTLNTVIVGRYFGRKAYASIRGVSMLVTTPIGVIAPIYAGWVYDTTGSYLSAFTIFAGLLTLAAVLMFFVLPPKPPAQVTDVHKFW